MNGLLCYPKCRSGFHNVGCCICSPNCPSKMTDIGISCAKHSYGRGAGKIPLTCRSNEDLYGLLCYPKCRAGYIAAGCCLCSKSTRKAVSLSDIADFINDIANAPIIKDVLGFIEDAVKELASPLLNAIRDLLPSIPAVPTFDFDTSSLSALQEIYEKLKRMITEQIDQVKELLTNAAEKIPGVPDQCPELVKPLGTLVLGYVPQGVMAGAATGALRMLMKVVNGDKACDASAGSTVRSAMVGRSAKSINEMTEGGTNKKPVSSKKSRRKKEQKNQLIESADLATPRLVYTELQSCKAKPSKSKRKRRRMVESTTLNIAFERRMEFLPGDLRQETVRSDADQNFGFFIQRIDLASDKGTKLKKSVECIWNVEPFKEAISVAPFRKDRKKKRGFSFRKKDLFKFSHTMNTAAWHPADLGFSAFYYRPANKVKISEWSENCEGDNSICPKHAGCRVSGDALIPHDWNNAFRNGGQVETGKVEKPNAFLHYHKAFQGKDADKLFFSFRKLQGSESSLTHLGSTNKENPPFYVIFGPWTKDVSGYIEMAEKTIPKAMTMARDRVFQGMNMLSGFGRRPPLGAQTERVMTALFGLQTRDETITDGFTMDPSKYAYLGKGLLKPGTPGQYKFPVFRKPVRSIINAGARSIKTNYEKIYDYLMDKKGRGIVLRDMPGEQNGDGEVVIEGIESGNIYMTMVSTKLLDAGFDEKDDFYISHLAYLIVHECSHYAAHTKDHVYHYFADPSSLVTGLGFTKAAYLSCEKTRATSCSAGRFRNLWCAGMCDLSNCNLGESDQCPADGSGKHDCPRKCFRATPKWKEATDDEKANYGLGEALLVADTYQGVAMTEPVPMKSVRDLINTADGIAAFVIPEFHIRNDDFLPPKGSLKSVDRSFELIGLDKDATQDTLQELRKFLLQLKNSR